MSYVSHDSSQINCSNLSNNIKSYYLKACYRKKMSSSTYKKTKAILAPIIDIPGFTWNVSTKKIDANGYSLNVETLHAKYEPQNVQKIGHLSIKPLGIETTTYHCTIEAHNKNFSEKLNLNDIFNQVTNTSLEYPEISTEENSISQCLIEKDQYTCHKLVLSFGDVKSDVSFVTDAGYHVYQMNLNDNMSIVMPEIYQDLHSKYPPLQSEYPCKILNSNTTNSLSDIILSRTYSSNPTHTEMLIQHALKTYGQYSYTDDVIKGMLSNIAIDSSNPVAPFQEATPYNENWYSVNWQEPIKISHLQPERIENNDNLGGKYQQRYNLISIFSGKTNTEDSFGTTFIHETGHYVMNGLFKNDSKPYSPSNLEQKNAYNEAELTTFKNLGKQLGLSSLKLDSLNAVDDVIHEIKNTPLMELMTYFQSLNKSKDEVYINEMRSKHGFSYLNDYLPNWIIDAKLFLKLQKSTSSIEVGDSEKISEHLKIMSQFSLLLFDYERVELEPELIIRIPHLLSDKIPLSTLETYFKPLMTYWDNHITPQVNLAFENHQEQCQNMNIHVPECLPNYLDIYQQGIMV